MFGLLNGSTKMYGIDPISGRMIKAKKSSKLEDFTFRSLRSHNAFSRKPTPRNVMQVMNSGINAKVSLNASPTATGSRVSNPAV